MKPRIFVAVFFSFASFIIIFDLSKSLYCRSSLNKHLHFQIFISLYLDEYRWSFCFTMIYFLDKLHINSIETKQLLFIFFLFWSYQVIGFWFCVHLAQRQQEYFIFQQITPDKSILVFSIKSAWLLIFFFIFIANIFAFIWATVDW